jgi:hypothetical protein
VLYEIPTRVAEEVDREIQLLSHGSVVARRIDADADELDFAPLELLVVPDKADQLPAAVRSPVAPVEDEHQGPWACSPRSMAAEESKLTT